MSWRLLGPDLLELRQSYVLDAQDRMVKALAEHGVTEELLAEDLGHSLDELSIEEWEGLQEFLDQLEQETHRTGRKAPGVLLDGKLRERKKPKGRKPAKRKR